MPRKPVHPWEEPAIWVDILEHLLAGVFVVTGRVRHDLGELSPRYIGIGAEFGGRGRIGRGRYEGVAGGYTGAGRGESAGSAGSACGSYPCRYGWRRGGVEDVSARNVLAGQTLYRGEEWIALRN